MKPRHTFGLLVLLLLLCAAYYGQQYYRGHREEAARVARKVFDFAPEDLRRLTIHRIDGPACTAQRDDDGVWRILEPNPTITPFQMMWDRVALNLSQTHNEHTVLSNPTDLTQYGLDTPALTVTGETDGGVAFQLKFGDLEPTQRNRYAHLGEGDLFLVSADTFFELNRSLTDLRHRFLVDDREAPLLEIEFAWIWTGGEEEKDDQPELGEESIAVVVRRDAPDAGWRLVEPDEAPANHNTVQALAEDLQYAVCKEFIDNPEDLSDYGLNPPRARITMKDAVSGRKQTVWLGGPDDSPDRQGVFARRDEEDAVVLIDPHLFTLLPHSPTEWRDRRLLTRRVTDINRFEYATEFDRFVMEKDGDGQWRLTLPVMDHVNAPAVSGFLAFFKEIDGIGFVENVDAQTVFAKPAARINLRFDDNTTAEILIAANPDDPETSLALQDSGSVVTLSQAATKMLLTDSENFRSRELLRFVKADVEGLAFVFEDTAYQVAKRHDQWVLLAPESMQLHNQADITVLMDAISPLFMTSAVTTEATENLDFYGLDAPVFEMTVTLGGEAPQPAAPVTLRIGAPDPANPDERFAQTSARTGVYRISQEIMDDIREALRGIY